MVKQRKPEETERNYLIGVSALSFMALGVIASGIYTQANRLDFNFILVPLFLALLSGFCFLVGFFAIKRGYVSKDIFTANLVFVSVAVITQVMLHLKKSAGRNMIHIDNRDIGRMFLAVGAFFLLLNIALVSMNINYVLFGIKKMWISLFYLR